MLSIWRHCWTNMFHLFSSEKQVWVPTRHEYYLYYHQREDEEKKINFSVSEHKMKTTIYFTAVFDGPCLLWLRLHIGLLEMELSVWFFWDNWSAAWSSSLRAPGPSIPGDLKNKQTKKTDLVFSHKLSSTTRTFCLFSFSLILALQTYMHTIPTSIFTHYRYWHQHLIFIWTFLLSYFMH